ncbi:MAG: HAMP domain-containing protein, partial [Acidobacteriota bacterium]
WRILSFPIFLKIMGIGFLTAILFGSVTLVQTRIGTSYILVQLLEEKVLDMSEMLAGTIEEQARSGNIPAISRDLNRARNIYTDMLYAIVTSPEGKILASTNRDEIPGDILNDTGPACPPDCATRTFKYGKGSIFEARIPISGNMVGVLRVGFTDDSITRQKRSFTGTVLWGLFLCITIGACLALLLTNILTRPLHHLVESANQIREGKFETRADIYSNDEVGRLAVAFNQMSEALNRYQKEVQAKEKARLSLIERIVQVQEDERKSISSHRRNSSPGLGNAPIHSRRLRPGLRPRTAY